ncbi:MAG: SAM-dependent methyltransferase [Pseudomonadota bacterium]
MKKLANAFGMELDNTGNPIDRKKDWFHADEAWKRYEVYRRGHRNGTSYALAGNPFANWTASQRYAHESIFNEQRVAPHRLGAEAVQNLIWKAQKDGFI